jgi:hypothetical protein
MGTVIQLFDWSLSERLDLLRDFIDEAEEGNQQVLSSSSQVELERRVNCVWPGVVALQPSWIIKLAFAWAGFAIGLGLHP